MAASRRQQCVTAGTVALISRFGASCYVSLFVCKLGGGMTVAYVGVPRWVAYASGKLPSAFPLPVSEGHRSSANTSLVALGCSKAGETHTCFSDHIVRCRKSVT